jgi:ABC-2 type transport system ATP-binding protein
LRVESDEPIDANGFRRVRLTTQRDDEIGETILQRLLARGLRVRAINRAHPTLEDVFLAATRRSWDVVAPAQADKVEELKP